MQVQYFWAEFTTFSLSTMTCGLTVQDLLVAEMKNSWWQRWKVQTLQHCSATVLDSSTPYSYYNNMHMQTSNFTSLKNVFLKKKEEKKDITPSLLKQNSELPPPPPTSCPKDRHFLKQNSEPPPTPAPKTHISVPDNKICILPLPYNFLFTVTDTDFITDDWEDIQLQHH